MRRAVLFGAAGAVGGLAAWAWWVASDAQRRADAIDSLLLSYRQDLDDLEQRTRQAFEAHAERLDALEARPTIEEALERFAQTFLAQRVRAAREQGQRPGPQG